MKHEVRRLLDETDVLQATADESNKLKSIAEKQASSVLTLLL